MLRKKRIWSTSLDKLSRNSIYSMEPEIMIPVGSITIRKKLSISTTQARITILVEESTSLKKPATPKTMPILMEEPLFEQCYTAGFWSARAKS